MLVTFVRPTSPCDTGEYAVVVDDRGHFVANVGSGTNVAYPTTPGPHIFYAWSNIELVVQSNPNFTAVGAVRVNVDATAANYVVIDSSKPCGARTVLDINSVSAMRDPVAGEAEALKLLSQTTSVVADRAAGQARLDARRGRVQAQMELGKMTLRRRDLLRADEQRMSALGRGESSAESGESGGGLDE